MRLPSVQTHKFLNQFFYVKNTQSLQDAYKITVVQKRHDWKGLYPTPTEDM
jgi:hypothetical protein